MRRNPKAVEITIGDLVLDVAAQKERDVDVTVTVEEADGGLSAFKAYEVKREGEPLDVIAVEQLCVKLSDMPRVTHRAIVSASHFTTAAIAKARAHNVDLFTLKPWAGQHPGDFGTFEGRERQGPSFSGFDVDLLCWIDHSFYVVVPGGPQSFHFEDATPIFDRDGNPHAKISHMGVYTHALLQRSTEILLPLEPAQSMLRSSVLPPVAPGEGEVLLGAAVPHTHTLCVSDDQAFLMFESRPAQIVNVTISGKLQWQRRRRAPEFYILESVPSGEPCTGAAIAEWGTPDGKMLAIVFSPESPTVGVHIFQLEEKQKSAIRKLKLAMPGDHRSS